METEEFEAILDAVRTFVRREVVPAELEIERSDDIPPRLREAAAAMGLFGFSLPQEYGGLGLTMTEEVELVQELGWTTPSFRSMVGTNNGIGGQILVNFGTEEQRDRYLPGIATGEIVVSFALTEPGAGSDPSGMTTRAVKDGAGYRITGQKRFITNAARSQILMVFARTDPNAGGTKGISVFAVPTRADGVVVGPKDDKMGQRGTTTSEVFFDDAYVDAGALIGGVEGEGFAAAMGSLTRGRLHISALAVGIMRRLLHESVEHARVATQGGQPIATFQLVQALIADCQVDWYASRAMVRAAAAAWDDGSDRRMAPSACKLFSTEAVGRVADRAVQIHGGLGYMREVPVERFYRDVRLLRLYEGTSEIQRLILARHLLRDGVS